MARILGRVEYGGDKPNRYFVHDDTSCVSLAPLVNEPESAWRAYDEGRADGLRAAVPQRSVLVYVVRKVLAHSRNFDEDGSIYGEPVFGLASDDRLLWPTRDELEDSPHSLLLDAGVLHVASEVHGGFVGTYDRPLCQDQWDPVLRYQLLSFEDMFGQALDLCPLCLKKLLDRTA